MTISCDCILHFSFYVIPMIVLLLFSFNFSLSSFFLLYSSFTFSFSCIHNTNIQQKYQHLPKAVIVSLYFLYLASLSLLCTCSVSLSSLSTCILYLPSVAHHSLYKQLTQVNTNTYQHCDPQVWQLETGRCQKTLVGHEDGVTTLTFDQTTIISGSLDCTIRLWSLATGQCVGVLDWMSSEGHTGEALMLGRR